MKASEVRLSRWFNEEAVRRGVTRNAIVQRFYGGLYKHMKVRRVNKQECYISGENIPVVPQGWIKETVKCPKCGCDVIKPPHRGYYIHISICDGVARGAVERHKFLRRRYYLSNRHELAMRRKARYENDAEHRENMKSRSRKYAAQNKEKIAINRAKYREKHREELNARQLAIYYANHEKHKRQHAIRRAAKREESRAAARRKSATLTDGYVREQLSKYSSLSTHEWPQEVVEAKKLILYAKRKLKTR